MEILLLGTCYHNELDFLLQLYRTGGQENRDSHSAPRAPYQVFIAEHLKVSRITVHRFAKRLKEGEDLKDQPRSGRLQVVNCLAVRRAFERNAKLKMSVIAKRKKISVTTVSRAVKDQGGRAYDAYKGL